MKRKMLIPVLGSLVVTGGIIAGLTINTDSASAYISEDEALEKVQKQFPGEVIEWELEKEGNKKYYEIEIRGTDRLYELEVDAETGDVLDIEVNVLSNKKEVSNELEATPKAQKVNVNDDDRDDQDDDQTNKNNTIISADEAKSIAYDLFDGKIEELELDEDDGMLYYEIEMYSATQEAEIEINAYTGELISISKEKND